MWRGGVMRIWAEEKWAGGEGEVGEERGRG